MRTASLRVGSVLRKTKWKDMFEKGSGSERIDDIVEPLDQTSTEVCILSWVLCHMQYNEVGVIH